MGALLANNVVTGIVYVLYVIMLYVFAVADGMAGIVNGFTYGKAGARELVGGTHKRQPECHVRCSGNIYDRYGSLHWRCGIKHG